ncbi:hypothetical protein [Natronospora cellulosivora (SeqCode)]
MQEVFTTQRQAQRQEESYQRQERMSRPPACITTKDLAYLKDALSWELLAMKKCNHYAQHCKNEEIRKTINTAGKVHQRHYKMLLMHLNPSKTIQNQ